MNEKEMISPKLVKSKEAMIIKAPPINFQGNIK